MLCIVGLDGRFKRLNPAFEQTLGFATEELLGAPFPDLVHSDDWETASAEIAKLSTDEGPRYFETRYRCKDGAYKWLLWVGTPDQSYQVIYLAAKDTTQSEQAEDALRESEHSYRTLAENLPGIVYRVLPDQNNRMIFFNNKSETLIGVRNKDLVGGEVCSIAPLIFPEDRSHLIATVKDAIERESLSSGIPD
ncbi:MAG: PAS domain S-box protein [Leptolyngbyaceae cyanobacterium MO_188.B28]|nr:PAS domain S-box protein [Leptolyngbyaceae cyanobacterium MO_188.B28]